jgi:hypothetical protein
MNPSQNNINLLLFFAELWGGSTENALAVATEVAERGSEAIGLGPKAAVKDMQFLQQAYELGKKI